MQIVLSCYQVEAALRARQQAQPTALLSPDLGLTNVEVQITPAFVVFADGQRLAWEDAETIRDAKTKCFVLEDDALKPVQRFSEHTSRLCSLMPTASAPTILIAGFPMHRIKATDPYQDTRAKVAALAPIEGAVLDTTTGLGYSAIQAAEGARHVTTIELDPTVLEIARLNPWSKLLFDNPKITQMVGDSYEEIQRFPDGTFARVLHDPPTISLAGDLYSAQFYREAARVLARGGRMFHYLGNPDSNLGNRVTTGVIRRLYEAGFRRVVRSPQAFGVVAYK